MKKWPWLTLSILVIICDQVSKYWVGVWLTPYKPMPVMPMLNFTLAFNTGAAFSFLSGAGDWHRWFFAGFSFVMSIILLIWLLRTPEQARFQSVGISLILGGALGNLIDRGLHGYVIDFIDVYYKHHHFATFNLADSAICIGAAILVLDLLIRRE
ncbi:TPA: lipoprotein signal peptidase [Legionella pneumophila]|jgi:signal peptidase II|uniref:Lipoprotein signal peptidase n=1 Tax=Legionella pneumophila TaxID=446 RepID=A0A2S6F205_LEGPN|nr:signal peptidase II [Legionella pneumophila]APF02748.1 signal peptidase II [Legionella pneumophila subsp. fraseri]APF05780.1 signal peptidase II [Legionella pneumophila subsp. fraseri]KXB26386.1 peptidase A8 [Legionella pneumophila]KXB26852.1 peptidase A8 [Legionella pneumophila]KZX34960.1 signal peptidase II [Legionella pneumophila]